MKIDVLVCCTSYPVFKDRRHVKKRLSGVALYDLSRSALLFYQAGNGMSIDFLNFFKNFFLIHLLNFFMSETLPLSSFRRPFKSMHKQRIFSPFPVREHIACLFYFVILLSN